MKLPTPEHAYCEWPNGKVARCRILAVNDAGEAEIEFVDRIAGRQTIVLSTVKTEWLFCKLDSLLCQGASGVACFNPGKVVKGG
jgi:hypothetical protein